MEKFFPHLQYSPTIFYFKLFELRKILFQSIKFEQFCNRLNEFQLILKPIERRLTRPTGTMLWGAHVSATPHLF
jgi:hypothetical protein